MNAVSSVQVDGATTIYTQTVADAANSSTTLMQLSQSFTFHEEAVAGQFAGRGFHIGASTLKWSLTLTSSSGSAAAAGGGPPPPLTVRYRLSEVMGTSGSMVADDHGQGVRVRRGVPQAQMTTYYVPFLSSVVGASSSSSSSQQLVALIEVWDLAVADGVDRPLAHDVLLVAADDVPASGSSSSPPMREYVLELRLPSFTTSLYYDPSLSLGTLVGASGSTQSKTDGIDSNTTLLVIAGVVGGSVILVGIAVGGTVAVLARRRRTKRLRTIRKTLMHTTPGLVRTHPHSSPFPQICLFGAVWAEVGACVPCWSTQNMDHQMTPYVVTRVKLSEKAKQENYHRHKETWLSA
jgi:hypothetical protein